MSACFRLLPVVALAICYSELALSADPNTPRVRRGTLAAHDAKTSVKTLTKGDVVLVSVSPSNAVSFKVFYQDGVELDAISFEHVGATKNFAVLIENGGAHKLVLQHDGDDLVDYTLSMGIVSASQSAAQKLNRLMALWHSASDPGAAITVTQDGKRAFVGTFGSADVEQSVDVKSSTVFDTASVAKHVTALAITMLAREGKLTLDDDIRKHVPETPDFGEPITLRHLLYHTSGLRDFPGLMILGDWHEYDAVTLEQVLGLVQRQRELNFPPGSEFIYSNTGYSLLAETVQRVTNDTLAVWAEKNLFSPLGMQHSSFLTDVRTIVPTRANGYSLTDPLHMVREPSNLAAMGSSSFFSTADDMALWMANFDSRTIGGEALGELMSVRGRSNNGDLDYGFGLGHGEFRGVRRVEHGGSSAGYRSHLLRFPDEQLSISVFCNQSNFDPASLAYFAAKLYLGDKLAEEARPPSKLATTASPKFKYTEVDIATLETYVGSYQIQPGEVIEVSREGNGLILRPKGHPEAPPIISRALSRTRFTGPPNGSIEFTANETGKVTKGLIRDGEKIIFEAERLDEPKTTVNLKDYEGRYFSAELGSTYELSVDDGHLVARQPKRTRKLSLVANDDFATNDGINITFERHGNNVRGFLASMGPRVQNVRFVKVAK